MLHQPWGMEMFLTCYWSMVNCFKRIYTIYISAVYKLFYFVVVQSFGKIKTSFKKAPIKCSVAVWVISDSIGNVCALLMPLKVITSMCIIKSFINNFIFHFKDNMPYPLQLLCDHPLETFYPFKLIVLV